MSQTPIVRAKARSTPSRPEEVYFFGTCLVDTIYPEAGLAAVELLEREGVRVIYPPDQTCCGQPPFNSGYREEARAVAKNQMALFEKPIPVVVPSGSCAAMLHEHYPPLFDGDEAAQAKAREFAARVFEWSDFMVNVLKVRLEDTGPPLRVTYHPSCHLLREMGVREAPVELLRQLAKVEVVPLPEATECCGFGGAFSVKQSAISWAMVEDKRQAVIRSGAQGLVAVDSGCLMQIGGAMAKAGQSMRAVPLPLFLKERTHDARS